MILEKLFVKLIAPEVKVEKSDEENYFDFETDTLYLCNTQEGEEMFLRHLREKHQCLFVDDFKPKVWTILHEIGHFETAELYDIEEDFAARAAFALIPTDKADKEMQDLYFDLESEWQATEWAIDYAARHYRKLKVLQGLLR